MFLTNGECLISISDAFFAFCLRVSVTFPTCSLYLQQKRAYSALQVGSVAWCPQMSADMLGTSWDQCWSMVQYSFTSTETRRLVRTDSPPPPPPPPSHSSCTMTLCYTHRHICVYIYRSMPIGIYQVQSPGFLKIVYSWTEMSTSAL